MALAADDISFNNTGLVPPSLQTVAIRFAGFYTRSSTRFDRMDRFVRELVERMGGQDRYNRGGCGNGVSIRTSMQRMYVTCHLQSTL